MAFPTNQFVSGHANPVYWFALGLAQPTILNVTQSSWDEEINTIIVTHSGSGGVAARIPNVLDGHGTVNADVDLLNPSNVSPPLVRPGISGIFGFFISPSLIFQCPTIIKKKHWETAVMGKASYSFDLEMNSLVGVYVPASA